MKGVRSLSPRRIVCGVDFSPLAMRALDVSVALARRSRGTVHAVHADESGVAPLSDIGLAPADDPNAREALRQRLERELAARRETGVKLIAHVEAGAAADTLSRRARSSGAELVVVGTHGRQALSHVLFGSVAERLVQTCPVSVLTVPHTARARWPFRTIVCATDFSESSRAALAAALSVLPEAEPELHVVHVLEDASFLGQFDHAVAQQLTEDLRHALDAEVEHFAPHAKQIMRHVRAGIVYDQILAEAQRADADLVVLGATGHTGVERAALGSVTARVARGCPVPVLVVRTPEGASAETAVAPARP